MDLDGMRTPPPKTHPVPHQSQLWAHWQLIGELRRSKKTWKQIAAELKDSYEISISAGSVRNFFKRASQGRLPLSVVSRTPLPSRRVTAVTPSIPNSTKIADIIGLYTPRKAREPGDEKDGDPFSTKVIPLDPWKPQKKSKAS
jgi:hypothetical protein